MDFGPFPIETNQYLLEQDAQRGRNTEMIIMSCTNGSDGYPSQTEFNLRMEGYIARKKRSERTVVSEDELAGIHALLSDAAVMKAEQDVSHRAWVKKTFILRSFINGTFVCHKDKGQSSPQPIASKEKMYFILKQAHASEGHGGRDKTAKAVKKTHSFIRKGLICLFLEICPTCRARNDAAKKDKITNIQASHVGVSPSGFEEQSLSFATWAHPQSQSSLRHTPYPDHRNSFYLGELAQVPSNQDPGSCLRRTPTRTDAGFLIHPQLSPGHSRCHTYPSMEGNNFSAPHNRPESPSRVNEASFSNAFRTLNQPVEFIMGAPPSNFGLPVNSFLAGQQVGFPEVLNAESLQGQEMVNTLYNSQIPQQTANITSNNIFDSINRDFLINQSGIRDEKSISFQTATYEPQSVPEFDIFQPVIMENLGMEHNIEDLISSTEIGNQIVDSAPYVYNHQPKTKDTSSPDASTSSLPSDTTQRMIVNKNHKQLSLLAPTLLNTSQNTILDREFSAFSGPSSSTSGVFWKADGDSNTPLLTAGLSSAVSTVSHNSQGYSDGSSGLSYPH